MVKSKTETIKKMPADTRGTNQPILFILRCLQRVCMPRRGLQYSMHSILIFCMYAQPRFCLFNHTPLLPTGRRARGRLHRLCRRLSCRICLSVPVSFASSVSLFISLHNHLFDFFYPSLFTLTFIRNDFPCLQFVLFSFYSFQAFDALCLAAHLSVPILFFQVRHLISPSSYPVSLGRMSLCPLPRLTFLSSHLEYPPPLPVVPPELCHLSLYVSGATWL